jgi:hypothetical protein
MMVKILILLSHARWQAHMLAFSPESPKFLVFISAKIEATYRIGCSQKHDGKIRSYARWQAHMLAFRSGRSRQSFSFSSPKL